MKLNKARSTISQNTSKTVRNITLIAALFSTLQSCDNASWEPHTHYKNDSLHVIPTNSDADIDSFEASLPYAQQWNQPLPKISEQDSMRIENQLKYNIIRSDSHDEKPTMDTVEHIVLHSTWNQPWKEAETIVYLRKTGKIHYLVKRDWTLLQYLPTSSDRLVQINHIGKWSDEKSNAARNRDPFITFKSIWIEVSTTLYQKWNDAQYETVKKLLWYLWEKHNLIQKDILTHTMVAYSKQYWLMRKYDPFGLEWNKLWLVPWSAQINKDVVSWNVAPNLTSMYERLRKSKTWSSPWWWMNHEEAIQYLQDNYSWVNNSIALHKQRYGLINPTNGQLVDNEKAWWNISDIETNMLTYIPKNIVYKKKQAKKAYYKKKRR